MFRYFESRLPPFPETRLGAPPLCPVVAAVVSPVVVSPAPSSSLPQPAADDSVLLVFNAWEGAIDFVLPPRADGKVWTRVIDTALDPQEDVDFQPGHGYTVTGRSLLMFTSKP